MNRPPTELRPQDGGAPTPVGPARRGRVAWRPLAATLAVLGLTLGADWARAPERQWTTRASLVAIDLYQATLSRGLSSLGARCRFTPSCSHYGEAVIRRDGIAVGGARALWRVVRCGPWTPYGTVDEPGPDFAVAGADGLDSQ
ncbi:MAG TPA: membrane protein insertion efficiency factor YidD [Thermoanaerobaculia bacterium]|nr:membrane protein insertion efficiency factor YidD [Thermoanaerobaculia bacterium]